MKGTINYYKSNTETPNSIEGWALVPKNEQFSSQCYMLTPSSDLEIRKRFEIGQIGPGDDVDYELVTDCHVDNNQIAIHSTKARIIFEKNECKKLFLIDIDGTICEDIRNEDSHLFPTAKVIEGSLQQINKWAEQGHSITFFTAREEKDRIVTLEWLHKHGFKFHELIMNKPRISDGQEYIWIDNKKVRAVTYLGNWSELVEVDAKIQIFS